MKVLQDYLLFYTTILFTLGTTHGASTVSTVLAEVPDDDDFYHTGVDHCNDQRGFLDVVNRIVTARIVLGAIALLGCISVIMVIYAHRRDRVLAHRTLTCLFIANIVFAASDVTPSNLYITDGPECGFQYMAEGPKDITGNCLPRGILFFGLYCSLSIELMMVALSIFALRSGSINLDVRKESLCYIACLCTGIAGAVGYYSECDSMLSTVAVGVQKFMALGQRSSAVQSLNDVFQTYREKESSLESDMQSISCTFVILALILYGYQRWLYHKLLQEVATIEKSVLADTADLNNQLFGERSDNIKSVLLQSRRRGYTEIVRPLEPYSILVLGFSIPLFVSVSSYCKEQNKAAWNDANKKMAPCELVCNTILSCRSIAMVAVFFAHKRRRDNLWNFPELMTLFWQRLCPRRFAQGAKGRKSKVRFGSSTTKEIPRIAEGESNSFSRADKDISVMGSEAFETLLELDDLSSQENDSVTDSSYSAPYVQFED